jgi:hypothetical protein
MRPPRAVQDDVDRIAAFALVVLVACGGVGGDAARPGAGSGPDSPVTSTPVDPTEPIPSPRPKVVEPQAGLIDVRAQPWDAARAMNDRTLLVAFYSGVHECYGVDRVDVEYAPQEVTVTLFIGRTGGNKICIEIAEYQAVKVRLDEPLDGRKIVDGAL